MAEKTKRKYQKATPRQKAVRHADQWMSKYIRARDRRCYICGKTDNLQNGHLITRGKFATRWDEKNCKCQCSGCNKRHEFQPEIFTSMWIEENGIEAYQELVKKSNDPVKIAVVDLIAIGDYYKKKYMDLKQFSFFD